MSDRYELLDTKAPCAWPSPPCQQDGINDRCPTCNGDGSRRVPTGRMVEDLAPFVWSGRDAAFLDCGDEGPAVGESTVFVEVTDDAE